ncbi:S66 peptidase family protein [Pseudonocardia sp. CA-107938]|uniref:S66 peptidase family protein n=1 Tax=Pseudonocardia sp. CA-107938 TaxID=3240021 RepID=UPI003D8C9DCC
MRRLPPRLRAGDRVVLVAPAGPPPLDLLDEGTAVLRGWGLDVETLVPGRHPRLPYLVDDDVARAKHLQQAWCDPDVAAVLCVRGGYGVLRMLDLLDRPALAAAPPKVFAGSSDITALHTELGPLCDLVTLFAPLIASEGFVRHPVAQEHLRAALFDPPTDIAAGPAAETVRGGRVTGVTVGGTLSLLAAGLGAPTTPPPPDGAIVLLEDITELPYRIDGLLTQLLRAGWFDRAAGIVCGSWYRCGDPQQVHDVLVDRLGPLGVPFVTEFGFGHCADQRTIPLGATMTLDADARLLRW